MQFSTWAPGLGLALMLSATPCEAEVLHNVQPLDTLGIRTTRCRQARSGTSSGHWIGSRRTRDCSSRPVSYTHLTLPTNREV